MNKIISLISLALALPAFAEYSYFGPPNSVAVTTTSAQVMPANNQRRYVIMVNIGAAPVVVKFGAVQSSATDGIPIPAGGNYEPLVVPANSIYAETASGTSTLIVVEGQ